MKKIAIIITASHCEWTGGLNYYSNLVAQCHEYASDRLKFTVITPPGCDEKMRKAFAVETVDLLTLNVKRSLLRVIRKFIFIHFRKDIVMDWFLKQHGIAIVSHSVPFYSKNIKVIGWIPDCQHKHMPYFFSEEELKQRDQDFQCNLTHCDRIIVSSQVAYDDLHQFYHVPKKKLALLRFYKQPVINSVIMSREGLEEKYQLSGHFFYIPNQFWVHKNHAIVIDALKLLAAENPEITVVCSGNIHDYRNPHYFPELMQGIENSGLQDRFKVIGLVPLEDVHALILYSLAMINPSLFEGWSTSVEEARANGKRIILSNIPVHREQSPPDALFFQPDSSIELAHRIRQVFSEFSELKEKRRQQQAKINAILLSRQFADEYAKIVESL